MKDFLRIDGYNFLLSFEQDIQKGDKLFLDGFDKPIYIYKYDFDYKLDHVVFYGRETE
jgi:hypothetical protein